MRNIKWLRYGLASVTTAAFGFSAFLIACGDDDAVGGSDSGADVTPVDDSGTDSGDAAKADAASPAKIVMINANSNMGPHSVSGAIRVCFATAAKSAPEDFQVTPFPILPHTATTASTPFPGIFTGTGGVFPASGADLEDLAIRPYLMNAESLARRGVIGNEASVPRCNRILQQDYVPDGGWPDGGSEPLVKNIDYWQLPDIPAGTFKKDHTYMLAVTGCTQNADPEDTLNGALCGSNDENMPFVPTGDVDGGGGNGNLKVVILELDDKSSVAATEMGVQIVHLSPQYQAIHTANPAAVPAFTPVMIDPDAGSATYVSSAGDAGEITYNRAATSTAPMVKLVGIATTKGLIAANPSTPASPATPFVAIPLNNSGGTPPGTVQALTTGDLDASAAQMCVNGKSYTYFLVGNPLAGAEEGTKRIHFLGFPNQFTPPPLQ